MLPLRLRGDSIGLVMAHACRRLQSSGTRIRGGGDGTTTGSRASTSGASLEPAALVGSGGSAAEADDGEQRCGRAGRRWRRTESGEAANLGPRGPRACGPSLSSSILRPWPWRPDPCRRARCGGGHGVAAGGSRGARGRGERWASQLSSLVPCSGRASSSPPWPGEQRRRGRAGRAPAALPCCGRERARHGGEELARLEPARRELTAARSPDRKSVV